MKTKKVIGTSDVAEAPDAPVLYLQSVATRGGVNIAPVRLQQALAQLEELQQALASGREEWAAARRQVARLTEANARLRLLANQRESGEWFTKSTLITALAGEAHIQRTEVVNAKEDLASWDMALVVFDLIREEFAELQVTEAAAANSAAPVKLPKKVKPAAKPSQP